MWVVRTRVRVIDGAGSEQVEEQSGATWQVGQLMDISPSGLAMLALAG